MLRKALKEKRFIILFLILLIPTFLNAQLQEYKDYIVEKGDTLWDISEKELSDSFLWPKVWKENPQIPNPDRIYPNQKIRIPLHLLQKEIPEPTVEIKPEIKPEIKEKPIEQIPKPIKEYLVDRKLLIASGYIADEVPSIGKITDSPTNRSLLSKGDFAYIKPDVPIKKGDKFYIIQSAEKVKHPQSGHTLGYLIEIIGIAEVAKTDDPTVTITDAFFEIPIGSLLSTYYELDTPLAVENPRMPDIDGYIVSTKQLHLINGIWDIVYIDKGSKNGIIVGDLLATTLQNKHKILNGLIQIIDTRDSTSTAIIRKNKTEITKGETVTGAMQEWLSAF